MCNQGDHYFCNSPNCVCACHPAPQRTCDNATWHKLARETYIQGAKDERRRLNDLLRFPGHMLCVVCNVPIPFPHASGRCSLCEVESRVE